jgi:hypothetical protein
VDVRVGPVDELAVLPDLLGLGDRHLQEPPRRRSRAGPWSRWCPVATAPVSTG